MSDDPEERAARAIDLAGRRIDELGQISIGEDLRAPCLLTYGWWVRVVRTCQAIKVLHGAGFAHEAAPMVRTAMHYAAAIVWLSKEPTKAAEAVRWQHQQKAQKLAGGAMKRAWDLSGVEELPEKPGPPPTGVDYLEKVEKLCDDFEMGNWYVGFMIESGFVHPSANGADAYLEPPGDGGEGKLWTTSRVPGTPLGTTAIFLWAATNAAAELLGDDGLRRLADELGEIINP